MFVVQEKKSYNATHGCFIFQKHKERILIINQYGKCMSIIYSSALGVPSEKQIKISEGVPIFVPRHSSWSQRISEIGNKLHSMSFISIYNYCKRFNSESILFSNLLFSFIWYYVLPCSDFSVYFIFNCFFASNKSHYKVWFRVDCRLDINWKLNAGRFSFYQVLVIVFYCNGNFINTAFYLSLPVCKKKAV